MSSCLSLEAPLKVSYLGPKGTYTQIAAKNHFGASVLSVPNSSVEEVFMSVERRDTHYGVVPVENSTQGIVSSTLDMFMKSSLKISGEIEMLINHNVLSNCKVLSDIKKIYAIKPEYRSCHTTVSTNGFIFEGHIPVKYITQFLSEDHPNASGNLDETGVDSNSKAHLLFSENIEANISCAINEEYENNLEIISGDYKLSVSQPWHCGQFQDGYSSIKVYSKNKLVDEISYKDEVGLFTREIDHASECIINNKLESNLISHADSQSIMLWLDKWRKELGIKCPHELKENSQLIKSKFFSIQNKKLKGIKINGFDKDFSKLALGCDNQTSDIHAFAMFDYFYGEGGRVFDTAYIYNNGMGDKYLGNWINSRGVQEEVIVLGKGAHTPDCRPECIKPQIIESLERLNLDKIDIYCLHRDNNDISVSEFIDVLDEIKAEGLINKIGASNWKLERFKQARDFALQENKEPFTILSNNFSLAEMIDPVWPGCVAIDNNFLDYVNQNNIILFPWSSTARGFFIKKKEIATSDHFSNPSMDEEKRVWHSESNLKKREICFNIAAERSVEPIEIALAYVIQSSKIIFPLIGPRTINELNSSIFATSLNLTDAEIEQLTIT